MTRLEQLIEGLKIIASVCPASKQDYDFQHDIMYVGGDCKKNFTPEALQKLDELGFGWNEEFDCWYTF